MKIKIKNKKMLLLLIIGIFVLALLGGTLAYWVWRLDMSQRTTITLTYAGGFSCTADGGGDITSQEKQLIPASCTNSDYAIKRTVTIKPTLTTVDIISLNLKLKIDKLSSALSETEHFKYAFTKSSSSCETDVAESGSFYGKVVGDTVDLLVEKEYILSEPDVYYLYIWLDSEETNNATMDQEFSFSLTGDCTNDMFTALDYPYDSEVDYYEYEAPRNGYYQLEAWGAQGGNAYTGYTGGKGAYTKGTIYLAKDEKIYIYVGSQGEVATNVADETIAAGGYNGGGSGYKGTVTDTYTAGGGGATDIRYFVDAPGENDLVWNSVLGLNSRIMVAAGGGGSMYKNASNYGSGGHGGEITGGSSVGSSTATGGSQTSSSFGVGVSYSGTQTRPGGGGGYYGGNTNNYNAGGGSSFISGYEGCNAITSASSRTATGKPFHYSGKIFNNTVMSAAVNTGNGKARITYTGKSDPNAKNGNTVTISYTGNNYTVYTVPQTGYYNIEAWGAQGGTAYTGYTGGKGAYTQGIVYLEQNQKLYIYVGGQGGLSTESTDSKTAKGGYNGGGNGYSAAVDRYAGGGGGATDIRYFGDATTPTNADLLWNSTLGLNSRIMVAAGGSGSYYRSETYYGIGGGGGELEGRKGQGNNNGNTNIWAAGGTQTSGDAFGVGNNAGTNERPGGGGGYWGGKNNTYSAGGGSSFISGHYGCNAITSTTSRTMTGKPFHYSGKIFNGSNMTYATRSGNGQAKITYLGVSDPYTRSGNSETFEYVDSGYYIYEAPANGYYTVEAWGAQGGAAYTGYDGGRGGYTKGTIYLAQNQKLYVYVGGQGGLSSTAVDRSNSEGGYNGGGGGHLADAGTNSSGGGGGATDIRYFGDTTLTNADLLWNSTLGLNSRIMVAAGGAGSYYSSATFYSYGGAGGGLSGVAGAGINGNTVLTGAAGTQTTGNAFGIGKTDYAERPGGGGGYWGGNSSNYVAGGGSSFISGYLGCNAITSASSRTMTDQPVHYSTKEFLDATMTIGAREGNGRAKITWYGANAPSQYSPTTITYNYDTSNQIRKYVVPQTGYYLVEAWGAQGGDYNSSIVGGKGGYTSGYLYMEQGENYYIYVGSHPTQYIEGSTVAGTGGWNGGGNGAKGNNYIGVGGGGATDIRYFGDTTPTTAQLAWDSTLGLNSRIMVAGGGGGAGAGGGGNGGGGGNLTGANGSAYSNRYGTGGSQTVGGGANGNTALDRGGFGNGGGGGYDGSGGSAGGGGYYGGGGTSSGSGGIGGGGGGGSSFISGYLGCNAIKSSSSRTATGQPLHYSNKGFINGTMTTNIRTGHGQLKITYSGTTHPNNRSGTTETIGYNGSNYVVYTAPSNGYYKIEAWGAQGGDAYTGYAGGKGAYTSGYINLNQNDQLYIYVGGQGEVASNVAEETVAAGGWNGGGSGYKGTRTDAYVSGGGGSTDIRYFTSTPNSSDLLWDSSTGLNARIMVAAGGGGSYYRSSNTDRGIGGYGGALFGGSSTGSNTATGGTQKATSFGVGVSYTGTNVRPGGGGGYYGGNTAGYNAGGGSSFISGYAGVNAITSISDRTHKAATDHYTGKYFVNTKMTANNRSGNGQVKITYVNSKPTRAHTRLDNVRYVKSCVSSNTVDATNRWIEIQAIKDGVNLAKGLTPGGTVSQNNSYPYTKITDGDIISSSYGQSSSSGYQCVTIDLGTTYNLDEVAVWPYYEDGRSYNEIELYVSSNNANFDMVMFASGVPSLNGYRVSAYRTDNLYVPQTTARFKYTGSFRVSGSDTVYSAGSTYATNWFIVTLPYKIYFLSSGTLTYENNTSIDAFLLGGGGKNVSHGGGQTCSANGTGGFHTVLTTDLTANTGYEIIVGATQEDTTAFGTTVAKGANAYFVFDSNSGSWGCYSIGGGATCDEFETVGSTYSGVSGSGADNSGKSLKAGIVIIRNAR